MSATSQTEENEVLGDYITECGEHLGEAASILLEIESYPEGLNRERLDALFRNFHTIKGLSGMVGLGEAERLAHHIESYLVRIREGSVSLSTDAASILIECVRFLESLISARQQASAIPDPSEVISRVLSLEVTAAETEPLAATDPARKLRDAVKSGKKLWLLMFAPSQSLANRGLTVSVIRERLKSQGEIVSAEPVNIVGQGLVFKFVFTAAQEQVSAWETDGLIVEPFKAPDLAATPLSTPLVSANLVRVELHKLDELMQTIGDLVVTRSRLDAQLESAASTLPTFQRRLLSETNTLLERQLRSLRESVMRVRLVPVREVFARMRFVVRDLARETGKDIELRLSGESTEIDKLVVERLADPLLHLMRNAVSHGLETPAERVAAGKPARGVIELRASASGGAAVIEIEDDGRGIVASELFERARQVGLVPGDSGSEMESLLDILCAPGFSTRELADRSSGRGVGMDVVRRAIEELGGTLHLHTQPGHSTRFTSRLPLMLAIADALIVSVGPETYAAPQAAIREVIMIEPRKLTRLENNELIWHHERVLPVLRLNDVFCCPRSESSFPALVIGEGSAAVALGVDGIIGLREIVVRRLADPLVQVTGLAGATELGDGRPVLILDPVGLARYARNRPSEARSLKP